MAGDARGAELMWTPQDVIALVAAIGSILTGALAAIYGRRAAHGIEEHEVKAEARREETSSEIVAAAGLLSEHEASSAKRHAAHERLSRLRSAEHEAEAERRAVSKGKPGPKPKALPPPEEPARCPSCGRYKQALKEAIEGDCETLLEGEG